MKTKVIMMLSLCLLLAGKANAQWVVTDPSNLAQGIINATKNIVHTSSTATNSKPPIKYIYPIAPLSLNNSEFHRVKFIYLLSHTSSSAV